MRGAAGGAPRKRRAAFAPFRLGRAAFPRKPPARATVFALVAAAHLALLFLVVFSVESGPPAPAAERVSVVRLADLKVEEPPPPLPPRAEARVSEAVAENILETEDEPDLVRRESGAAEAEAENYLGQSDVSYLPEFNDMDIRRATSYPSIALRSGITGRVYLEIFVDREGYVRQVRVLKETPEGHGFGEAAARAFQGKRGKPALSNGEAVAVRYRYPVAFQIR